MRSRLSLPHLIKLLRVLGIENAISKSYFLVKGIKLSEMDLMYGIVKNSFLDVRFELLSLPVFLNKLRNSFLECSVNLDLIVLKMK